MKIIGVLPNGEKDQGFRLTREILRFIAEDRPPAGDRPPALVPRVPGEVAAALGLPQYACGESELFARADLLVVLGGDGTILRAAAQAARRATPILGINLGTLGYLTDADPAEALGALGKVLAGEGTLQRRMMLQAAVAGRPLGKPALNDVCVLRGVPTALLTLDILINGEFIHAYRADGVIISTPTGSTAYNLSAGGPVLKPDAEMIAVTPICPHTLHLRPLVLSSEDVVTVRCGGPGMLSLDGRDHVALGAGTEVRVEKSEFYTNILKTKGTNFYEVLRLKMENTNK